MDGWVSLHRKIMNHAVFSDPQLFRLFTICLMKATYTKRSVSVGSQKVDLEPGQFITGRDSLADDYNDGLQKKVDKVNARTVWRWIKRLETWECLSCNSSNKFTVITVVNWAEYQDTYSENVQQSDQLNVQLVSSTCPTDVQLVSTNNKEIKKQGNKETSKDKTLYGSFVLLTQTEHDKLVEFIGSEEGVQEYIDRLNDYAGQYPAKAKKYDSHYSTIRNWARRDRENQKGGMPNAINRRGSKRSTQQTEPDDELDRIQANFIG